MVRLHGLVSRQGGEEPPLFLAVQLAERPPPRPMEGPARHPECTVERSTRVKLPISKVAAVNSENISKRTHPKACGVSGEPREGAPPAVWGFGQGSLWGT